MPAIKPADLKIQCAELADEVSDSKDFVTHLHDLLSYYADRVRRPGEAEGATPLIDSYLVPPPVLRFLERELIPWIERCPEESLQLADILWEEKWLETRHLAIKVLSHVPGDEAESILSRVRSWGDENQEKVLQQQLFTKGVSKIRETHPEALLELVADFMESNKKESRRGGLYALIPLLEDDSFQNLPVVYRLLSCLLQNEETSLLKEIVAVIEKIAKRSQQEAAFFLREKLKTASKPRIFRIVRQSLPFFSDEYARRLREDLRKYE